MFRPRYLFIAINLFLFVGYNPTHAHQQKWKNCVHYLSKFPSYRDYKPPDDSLKSGCAWGNWVTFSQKIIAIETKVGKWKNPIDLFRSKDFLAMYKHPEYYTKHVLAYLGLSGPTSDQKRICIYAMRKSREYTLLLKTCFSLYKQERLSATIFQDLLNLKFTYPNKYVFTQCLSDKVLHNLLEKISNELEIDYTVKNFIKKTLSGSDLDDGEDFPSNYSDYLPFQAVCHQIQEEYCQYMDYDRHDGLDLTKSDEYNPDFLIILDHPCYYLFRGNESIFLRDDCKSTVERYWAIVAMSQIGLSQSEQECNEYSELIKSACDAYVFSPDWNISHTMPVGLMELLFCCKPLAYFKYPFFIINYKDKEIRKALNRFIALPTIPCALKDMAQKILVGKLASKEEMEYMKGYLEFRKTHFTLYETIQPHAMQ